MCFKVIQGHKGFCVQVWQIIELVQSNKNYLIAETTGANSIHPIGDRIITFCIQILII